MLFDELLNETAVPRINANARGSTGATRRIVVYVHPIKVFAGHPRAFVLIGGEVVRRAPERNCCTADQRQCPPIARRGATDRRTRPSPQSMCWSSAGIRVNRRRLGNPSGAPPAQSCFASAAEATRAVSASSAAPINKLPSAAKNRGVCAGVASPPGSRAPMRRNAPGMRSM